MKMKLFVYKLRSSKVNLIRLTEDPRKFQIIDYTCRLPLDFVSSFFALCNTSDDAKQKARSMHDQKYKTKT